MSWLPKHIFIIAKTARAADDWRRAHCLPREQAIFVSSREVLLGQRGAVIVTIGNYWERTDYHELFDGTLLPLLRATIYREEEFDQ